MITLKNIKKSFNDTSAVDGISIQIKPGEIVGLLGPNGAGKTTTLRMMAGVLPPTSGSIKFNGKNFEQHEFEIKETIGYLPENNPLYDDMTVEEHLRFWAQVKSVPEPKIKESIDYAVKNTGISSVYYRLINELSKGYRQRAGLAQAILTKPDVLLLDEPTEGLDPNQRRDIQTLLSELKKSRTVIVSSHVLGEISKLANRIVIIHDGKIVGDDSPKKLVSEHSSGKVIKVEGKGRGLLTGLKSIKGVSSVTKEDTNLYEIIVKTKKDIRPVIFELAAKKKWKLLEVKQIDRQLSDIFQELTKGQS